MICVVLFVSGRGQWKRKSNTNRGDRRTRHKTCMFKNYKFAKSKRINFMYMILHVAQNSHSYFTCTCTCSTKKKISVVGFITPDYTNYWQVFRSIGYKSVNIDVGIPFDSARGLIPNTAGRVDSSKGMPLLLCLLLMHRHCMIVKLCDIVPVLWFKQYYKVSVKSPA